METNRATIFITAFTNFIVRNILNTDFFRILKNQPDLRIVILAPKDKKDYIEKKFTGDNVTVEGVDILPLSKTKIVFGRLARMLLNTRTVTLYLRLRLNFRKPLDFLEYYLSRFVGVVLGAFRLPKSLLRALDYRLLPKNRFQAYFERYHPKLVFSTDITDLGAGDSDIDLIREAKARKVTVVGMVRSWDNLTGRGIIREVPDKIIVHNKILKKAYAYYNGLKTDNVLISGIPHYDNYLNIPKMSREEFFRVTKLDPQKKLILFAPIADKFLYKQLKNSGQSINRYILELLSRLDADKVQILARFPLIGGVDLGDFTKPANMIFDYPDVLFGKGELNAESDEHLINSLYHSDVVLPGASTLAVDALVFNKPIIFVAFNKEKKLPYYESMRKFLDLEHLRPLIVLRAAKVAKTEEKFLACINEYLENPDLDAENRKKTVQEICWKLDGRSGERLANLVLGVLNKQ